MGDSEENARGLMLSLREIAGSIQHSDVDLAQLAEVLWKFDVECWRDLLRASAEDFPALRVNGTLVALCNALCRAADAAAASHALLHHTRAVVVTQPRGGQLVPATASARSRSPVALGARLNAASAAVGLAQARSSVAMKCADLRPLQAMKAVASAMTDGLTRTALMEQARVEAVIGSAPGSIASAASGLRCWAAFCDGALQTDGHHLPPTVSGLVAFSLLFRNHRTFGNYLSYIVLGCHLVGLECFATTHPLVKRAKTAIRKWQAAPPPRMFVQMPTLVRLVALANREKDTVTAMYYLAIYSFLLRPRAEGFGITVGEPGSTTSALAPGLHSAIELCDGKLVLRLARRKNRPYGSVLRRQCWCHQSADTCPDHVLGSWLARFAPGVKPFACLYAGVALPRLRTRLATLGVANHTLYKLHDFRRGHAQDLLEKGSNLKVILAAGEWSSSAFTAYLDTCDLESRAVLEAHWAVSEDDA